MPLYRSSLTGEIVDRPERYVLAYPEGRYTRIGETHAERAARELRIAEEEKVDLEDVVPEERPEEVPVEVPEVKVEPVKKLPSIKKGRK